MLHRFSEPPPPKSSLRLCQSLGSGGPGSCTHVMEPSLTKLVSVLRIRCSSGSRNCRKPLFEMKFLTIICHGSAGLGLTPLHTEMKFGSLSYLAWVIGAHCSSLYRISCFYPSFRAYVPTTRELQQKVENNFLGFLKPLNVKVNQ